MFMRIIAPHGHSSKTVGLHQTRLVRYPHLADMFLGETVRDPSTLTAATAYHQVTADRLDDYTTSG